MRRVLPFLALLCMLASGPVSKAHQWPSLPVVAGSPPGPSLLYAPPATAPELTNRTGWSAPSLMVSGAQAYDAGEYLYQDYVYDSYGANTTNVPLAPPDTTPAGSGTLFGGATGDVVYPTNVAKYGNDAADILEVRAKLDQDNHIVFRITLNTMLSTDVPAIAIGLSDPSLPGGTDDWGYGIGSLGHLGLRHVIYVSSAKTLQDGSPIASSFDLASHQIEVFTTLNGAGTTWRTYLVAGLASGDGFKQILDDPTADMPGGAHGTNPPPIFNVAFRFNEPAVRGDLEGTVANPLGSLGTRTVGAGHWREHAQALALAARDISAMHADIDFSKIADQALDYSGVPTTGFLSRLYVSRFDLGQGVKATRPMLLGRVQPYGLYVPSKNNPERAAPFVLALHSLSCSYNQYAVFAPNLYQQLGEDRHAMVLTTEGRGPDGWYHDEAEADLFEAWADVARHYTIDWSNVAINGYSMGGYATWKLASQYPDLFTSAFGVVGPGDEAIQGAPTDGISSDAQSTLPILANLRQVPLMMWNGSNDELVPLAGALNMARRMETLGYEHEVDIFPGFDHFLFSDVDQWKRGAAWIDRPAIDRDPSHITYVTVPAQNNTALGIVHNHAYWVSDIQVSSGAASGLVDARSYGANHPEKLTSPTVPPAGTDPAPYVAIGDSVSGLASHTISNSLSLDLQFVTSLGIWTERAGLDLSKPISMFYSSTDDATLTLHGPAGTRVVSLPSGSHTVTI